MQWRLVVSSDERRLVESASGVSMTYPCYRQGNVLHISGVDELGQKANGTLQFDHGFRAVIFNQTTSAQVLFVGATVSYSGRLVRENAQ
jgi:hypothetical protein